MKIDWVIDHLLGWLTAGVLAGLVGGLIVATYPGRLDKDKLYVDCIYNMRDRTIDQLEIMCSHLRPNK